MRSLSLQDLNLSSEELKEVAKLLARKRGIKDYESMYKDKLLSDLKESEKNFDKTRTEKIREEIKKLQHKLFKSEIKEIKKTIFRRQKTKRVFLHQKYLHKLEGKLSRLKKYYDYDDAEYKGIKYVKDLFD